MQPAGQMVLCKIVRPEVSKGGIIIPSTATDATTQATHRALVVSIGPGLVHVLEDGRKTRVTPQEAAGVAFRVGDTIVISRYTHRYEDPEAGELRLARAEDVLGIL